MCDAESREDGEPGSYAQLFVQNTEREPRHNDASPKPASSIFKKHGMLSSEFFQPINIEAFKDFTNIVRAVSAGQEEEVWIEPESYLNREHRNEVVAKIRQSPREGPISEKIIGLVTEEPSILGDFNRLKV